MKAVFFFSAESSEDETGNSSAEELGQKNSQTRLIAYLSRQPMFSGSGLAIRLPAKVSPSSFAHTSV